MPARFAAIVVAVTFQDAARTNELCRFQQLRNDCHTATDCKDCKDCTCVQFTHFTTHLPTLLNLLNLSNQLCSARTCHNLLLHNALSAGSCGLLTTSYWVIDLKFVAEFQSATCVRHYKLAATPWTQIFAELKRCWQCQGLFGVFIAAIFVASIYSKFSVSYFKLLIVN